MKRTYTDLRVKILESIGNNKRTINDISRTTGINWKTVQRHLIYLKGSGYIVEVFSSPYVRIFELTDKGKEEIK